MITVTRTQQHVASIAHINMAVRTVEAAPRTIAQTTICAHTGHNLQKHNSQKSAKHSAKTLSQNTQPKHSAKTLTHSAKSQKYRCDQRVNQVAPL
jgi:3-phosphoglycerate kinase